MNFIREGFIAVTGVLGGVVASLFGGWDLALQTLVTFMVLDYATGLVIAGVFKKSRKSLSGALESNTGFKGIIKKCMVLLMVLIGYRLDNMLGVDFVRYAVIIAFVSNELLSIIENAGLMGVPIPAVLQKAIGILNERSGGDEG